MYLTGVTCFHTFIVVKNSGKSMEVGSGEFLNNNVNSNQTVMAGRQQFLPFGSSSKSFGIDSMVDENCEDFFNYLERLGLSNNPNLLVIPSTHHYYYDAEDLKEVKTVINLKQLNHVKQVRDFLRTISHLLPHKSNFIGCFVDNKTQNGYSDRYSNLPGHLSEKSDAYENGIESRIPFLNRVYSLFDSKTNRYLTRRTVTQLLEESGLRIVGMTELNGLTYFCTEKGQHHPAA